MSCDLSSKKYRSTIAQFINIILENKLDRFLYLRYQIRDYQVI